MGDADNSSQPSKKRAAGVQLSRENPGLDDNEDSPEMEAGTFKKASEEVLATRRIVKVRRQPASLAPAASAPSSASNPFAAIRLVPTASPAAPAEAEPHTEKTDASKPENEIDVLKGESTEEHKKTDGNDDSAKQSESKIVVENESNDVSEHNPFKTTISADNSESKKDTEGEGNVKDKENLEVVLEGGNPDDGVKKTTSDNIETEYKKDVEGEEINKENKNVEEVTGGGKPDERTTAADNIETESEKDVKAVGNNNEKINAEATSEKNTGPISFGMFQQLSNSQNAFSGITGTGFSSTSFSFGSASKDGQTGFSSTAFSFGSGNKDGPTGFSGTPLSFGSTNNDGQSPGSGTAPAFGLNSDGQAFGFGKSFGPSYNGGSSIFGTFGVNNNQNDGNKNPPMQEVPVETGEENEKSVFTADSVLFEFTDGAWKERGKGEVKINVPTTETGKARLIMRARGNFRLILNASLFPDMKLTNMDKKGVTFACMNSAAEGKEGLSTVALRFKDASVLEDFRAVATEYKSKANTALKTPENSPEDEETS